MRFTREQYGDELTRAEVDAAIDVSIAAAAAHIKEAIEFRQKLAAGNLKDGDSFTDYTIAEENGYDRTGLFEITAEKE